MPIWAVLTNKKSDQHIGEGNTKGIGSLYRSMHIQEKPCGYLFGLTRGYKKDEFSGSASGRSNWAQYVSAGLWMTSTYCLPPAKAYEVGSWVTSGKQLSITELEFRIEKPWPWQSYWHGAFEYRMKHMSWEGKNNGKVEGKGGMRWDPKKEIQHIWNMWLTW